VSIFHIMRFRTHFRRHRGPLHAVFKCCDFGVVIEVFEIVVSYFHFLRYLTHFWRSQIRCVHFSRFALNNSFSTIRGPLCVVFKFCDPRLVNDGFGIVVSDFDILRSHACLCRLRRLRPIFKFYISILIFDGWCVGF
jgi:hypothetical protein